MAPRQLQLISDHHGAFHHFILNSIQRWFTAQEHKSLAWRRHNGRLGAIFNQPRRSLWTFLHRPAQAVRNQRRRRRHCIFQCLQHGTAESSCHRARSKSHCGSDVNVQRFLERRQPPIQSQIKYSVYKRILDLFLENDAAVFPVQLSLFPGLVFIIHTLRRFHKFAHFQKQRIGRFRFQYINRLCVLVATLEQIKPLFQLNSPQDASFKFSVPFVNLRAAQMERTVAKKSGKELH
ncbi:Hypothetical_protein [Hexamita inflata]|uniref:Hypothetical_protein n=1 Tax=Hexamita inflata TaxID=28002 RepID=A0AA86QPR1_9EUKA|nr:Hypothetical protein HINF_LOCUS51306 [Hexamita inflata]